MNEYKKGIYIKWYNENHDDKITDDDVWIDGNCIKDTSNGRYDVLSTQDIEDIKKQKVNEYAEELKDQINWILRQSNLGFISDYILIDKKRIYDEYNQFDTRILTDCKDWLAQEYPFEGDWYDIIQV